jgi:DNA invertase Pin-like site-specific DNA recombinase
MNIGYVRISTREQSTQLQDDAMAAAGITKVYADIGVSGSLASRPEFDKALAHLREGDVLTVWKLDRLGRNTRNVLEVVEGLTARGIGFRSLTEGLDTSGPMGKAMLTVMAAFAELERSTMLERTHAGLAAAKAQGRVGGRPRALDAKKLAQVRKLVKSGDHTRAEIAKMVGISPATLYRVLADLSL